jgi:cbb3-type cytochrome oxidase subunit 1
MDWPVRSFLRASLTWLALGVAYHVIPRFSGRPLRYRRLAVWHVWAANAGLALMVLGFGARVHSSLVAIGTAVLALGGCLSALGAYAFALNLWRTIPAARPVTLGRGS